MSATELVAFFEAANVRVVVVNGEPWFVASDVCDVLQHSNSRMALSRLDDDEKSVALVYTRRGNQKLATVNECGLYHLIFTSRLPRAAAFRKWITSEVLPTIRKTGGYGKRKSSRFAITFESQCSRLEQHYHRLDWCRAFTDEQLAAMALHDLDKVLTSFRKDFVEATEETLLRLSLYECWAGTRPSPPKRYALSPQSYRWYGDQAELIAPKNYKRL
jgi:prophage antirepressor-like protein